MAEVTRAGARLRRGVMVFLVAIGLLVGGSYLLLGNPARMNMLQAGATPTPQAQATPDETLKVLRATEEAMLTTYGWVDRANGVVRIPIDRAIDLLLQRGLPTRP
jgi:hypothetical protein